MRSKVIKIVDEFLRNNNKYFFSEAEFQFNLGVELQKELKKETDNCTVHFEYLVRVEPDDTLYTIRKESEEDKIIRMKIDLVVEMDGVFMPIELKFFSSSCKNSVNTGSFLFGNSNEKRQLEDNNGHWVYNIWKDVYRIEYIDRKYHSDKMVRGISVLLTNDSDYWLKPKKADAMCADFRLNYEKTELICPNKIKWKSKKKTKPTIDIKGTYKIEWKNTKNDFRYLIFDSEAE